MAFGGVSVTPMQTLAFYNAVANNGVLVKPQFVSEIKEWNKTIVKMKRSH
jgi:cell division protein FtsI (penicillin-binding protein 3)